MSNDESITLLSLLALNLGKEKEDAGAALTYSALEEAIKALNKQIPATALNREGGFATCPSCGASIILVPHCPKCGQALKT
ncbi:MAG: hypothetical protein LUD72_06955 [Bacteroidales bacterium]|nr:hypothetical protein [Bacteroidales bacterium]